MLLRTLFIVQFLRESAAFLCGRAFWASLIPIAKWGRNRMKFWLAAARFLEKVARNALRPRAADPPAAKKGRAGHSIWPGASLRVWQIFLATGSNRFCLRKCGYARQRHFHVNAKAQREAKAAKWPSFRPAFAHFASLASLRFKRGAAEARACAGFSADSSLRYCDRIWPDTSLPRR
jgi:hypothetical protein